MDSEPVEGQTRLGSKLSNDPVYEPFFTKNYIKYKVEKIYAFMYINVEPVKPTSLTNYVLNQPI